MDSVESLIRQCAEGEDAGWEELCEVIDHIASVPIRQFLRTSSETLEDADDLRQEFFLYLRRHSARRIRHFRGTSEVQLRSYLRVLVVRFVRARLAQTVGREAWRNAPGSLVVRRSQDRRSPSFKPESTNWRRL